MADPATEALLARARSLELATAYQPPPGDPLAHHAAGFAKVMCSAVFITGLDPDFAAENVGYFTAPYEVRGQLGKPVVDHDRKAVHVTLPGGLTRTAQYFGDQGCVTLPLGQSSVNFTPQRIDKRPEPSVDTPWPMGDAIRPEDRPAALDAGKLEAALDAAFDPPEQLTAAVVVTWKGKLVAERYGPGITLVTPLESWSMGKSVAATLMGVLIGQGAYDLWQAAPIPQWRTPGDPRAEIRIADILRMSSGLRSRAPLDPDFDPAGPYPDHLYLYTGGIDAFAWAATRPQQWPPGAVGRYRNVDPVLIGYLIRLAVEARGEDYLSFPQRALFDRLGARSFVLEVDPFGNFLTQGYELACARDWARLANLYLQDGVWLGERILPQGWRASSAPRRPPGPPTAGRSTAASSGSTAMTGFPPPGTPTTWPAPAVRPPSSSLPMTWLSSARATSEESTRPGRDSTERSRWFWRPSSGDKVGGRRDQVRNRAPPKGQEGAERRARRSVRTRRQLWTKRAGWACHPAVDRSPNPNGQQVYTQEDGDRCSTIAKPLKRERKEYAVAHRVEDRWFSEGKSIVCAAQDPTHQGQRHGNADIAKALPAITNDARGQNVKPPE